MSSHVQPDNNGGNPTHLSDCYVWIEILYLDSPTNYREYLPGRGITGAALDRSLELLAHDNSRSARTNNGTYLWTVLAGALLLAIIIVFLVSYCTWL